VRVLPLRDVYGNFKLRDARENSHRLSGRNDLSYFRGEGYDQ
jgi:hypothetical protein